MHRNEHLEALKQSLKQACGGAGTLYVSDSNTQAVSPGEKGWVIAREPWPGHLLSFVRGTAVQNKWRGIRVSLAPLVPVPYGL